MSVGTGSVVRTGTKSGMKIKQIKRTLLPNFSPSTFNSKISIFCSEQTRKSKKSEQT